MMAIRKRYGKHERLHPDGEGGVTMTKQSMKDEVDVNQIVARFRKTGAITHLAKGVPVFMDVSEAPDYRTALDHVIAVQGFFDGLSAPVRAEFGNDPAEFLDFVTDPANADRIVELGLVPPEAGPELQARDPETGQFIEEPVVDEPAPNGPA